MVAPMATRMPMALAAPANYGAELACGIPYAAEMACGIPYAAMEPDCGCMSGYSEMDEPYMMAPGEFVDPTPLAE